MYITDDIRKKQWFDFKKPLESEERNLFDEYFALAILKYCYPEKYKDFTKEEAPDLQRKDKKHGVEVTLATSKVIAPIEGNYSNYRNTSNAKQKNKLKEKIEKAGGKFGKIGFSYPSETSQDDIDAIEDVIEKKVKKLKSYQEKGFEKMELLIRHSNIPCILDKNKYIDLFKKAEGYETVYFTAPCCLMCYKVLEGQFEINCIPEDDYNALKVIARLTVEGEIEFDSKIWK